MPRPPANIWRKQEFQDKEKTEGSDKMSDAEKLSEAVSLANAAMKRACWIAEEAPYCKFLGEPDHALLEIDGDNAKLSFRDDEYGKGTVEFPTALLLMSTMAVAAWKAKERELSDRREEGRRQEQKMAEESRERALLRDLQAKYGVSRR